MTARPSSSRQERPPLMQHSSILAPWRGNPFASPALRRISRAWRSIPSLDQSNCPASRPGSWCGRLVPCWGSVRLVRFLLGSGKTSIWESGSISEFGATPCLNDAAPGLELEGAADDIAVPGGKGGAFLRRGFRLGAGHGAVAFCCRAGRRRPLRGLAGTVRVRVKSNAIVVPPGPAPSSIGKAEPPARIAFRQQLEEVPDGTEIIAGAEAPVS